ncbi:MAG: hypothetical protein H7124_14955 [Phycisphaerales bacterium]|nr:hypothetical protein [Hyphomonadaceae bacterium]
MMWMGKASAWMALAVGALFGVNADFQFATGVPGWIYIATAIALIVASYRTLRKMSGGLRLLAGAWGFAGGLLALPFTVPQNSAQLFDAGALVLFLVAFAGLALTVLHKER